GQRGGKFVVRIEDQDAQVWPRFDRLAHQERDGGGLADAGCAHHGEVTGKRIVDGDARVQRLVLRKLADLDGAPARKIVDRLKIKRPDAVRHRADMRIDRDAAIEYRSLRRGTIANLSNQFHADLDGV